MLEEGAHLLVYRYDKQAQKARQIQWVEHKLYNATVFWKLDEEANHCESWRVQVPK